MFRAVEVRNQVVAVQPPSATPNGESESTPVPLSFQDKIRPVVKSPGAPVVMQVAPPEEMSEQVKYESPSAEELRYFQRYLFLVKENLTGLEQVKKNSELLSREMLDHKAKGEKHAKNVMTMWANAAETSANNVPNEYMRFLDSTRDYLMSDRDYLIKYSNSLYDALIGTEYFLNPDEVRALDFTSGEMRKCQTLDYDQWVSSTELSCDFRFVEQINDAWKTQDARLIRGADKLAEVDNIILDTISKHASAAQDAIKDDMDYIARSVQLNADISSSFESIRQQAQRTQYQEPKVSPVVFCQTSTKDSIFDENRTYYTSCEPDKRTEEQKCDAQIAMWLKSRTGLESKPKCQGS